MVDDKYTELINKEIDGVSTPEESAMLKEYLGKNPDAEKHFRELRRTCELIEELEPIEPKPSMKNRVMNSIDPNRYVPKKKSGFLRSAFAYSHGRPGPRLAWAFSFGLVIGFLAYSVLSGDLDFKQGIDGRNMHGTIGFGQGRDWKLLDEIPVVLPGIEGSIVAYRSRDITGVHVDLEASEEIALHIRSRDDDPLFSYAQPVGTGDIVLQSEETHTSIRSRGHQTYRLFFISTRREGGALDIEIMQQGKVLLSGVISLNPR
jgi:hypothetical protein